jgi:hypothetical protein
MMSAVRLAANPGVVAMLRNQGVAIQVLAAHLRLAE